MRNIRWVRSRVHPRCLRSGFDLRYVRSRVESRGLRVKGRESRVERRELRGGGISFYVFRLCRPEMRVLQSRLKRVSISDPCLRSVRFDVGKGGVDFSMVFVCAVQA